MERRPRSVAAFVAALVAACVGLPGCGGESYPMAPVSGVVTLDGAPLADARIGFEPIQRGEGQNAGPGSYGKTDSRGRFTLTSRDGAPGAVVGENRVWVRTLERNAAGDIAVEEKVPLRFNNETELVFEVPADGTDDARFDLLTE